MQLAPPWTAQHLFDARWYDPSGRETVPGGIITSAAARRAARSAPIT
jgi:hypothetical protein